MEVYRERHFVKLADEGIDTLGEASCTRAIAAADSLGAAIRRYNVQLCRVYATAALRTASNGPQLKAKLEQALGAEVSIIDGRREAELIARGVQAARPPAPHYLVMDIGGGSVEFIVVKGDTLCFRESYPIGAQVLRHRFSPPLHTSSPRQAEGTLQNQVFGSAGRTALDHFLATTLHEVQTQLNEPLTLVGASGTFDVLADLYGKSISDALTEVEPRLVTQLYHESAEMTDAERAADPRIPAERADMIVVALGLIDFWVQRYPQLRILTCAYALKEGALLELLSDSHGAT